ncbi:MAG TPA: YdcF family protein [Verrucomicrobiae bacterium]|nr:YdcF family protein [Verrucomicrobiae bacterium]
MPNRILKNALRTWPGTLSVWLSLLCLVTIANSNAQERQARIADAQTQENVWALLQKVIAEHWNGGESKTTSSTNTSGSETNVEGAFRAASKLMPERLDLKFGVASALIGQALGTNGQRLETKVREALVIYQEIENLDTNGFEAPLLFGAYARALGDTNASESVLQGLLVREPDRTRDYLQKFERIDRLLQTTPVVSPRSIPSEDRIDAIVVLGAGLETNGLMKTKLIRRLKQCLKLARMHPDTPIILTGGNPKDGITEAYAMRRWCLKKGISKKRLWLEDKARDTVENALYTSVILQKLQVSQVTLVTSVSHMRRGLADLDEACLQRGLKIHWSDLAARTKGDVELDKEQERLGIYRDVLRISGLWSFPGIQR